MYFETLHSYAILLSFYFYDLRYRIRVTCISIIDVHKHAFAFIYLYHTQRLSSARIATFLRVILREERSRQSYTEGLFACSRKLARRQRNPLRLIYARVDELTLLTPTRFPACTYLFIFRIFLIIVLENWMIFFLHNTCVCTVCIALPPNFSRLNGSGIKV